MAERLRKLSLPRLRISFAPLSASSDRLTSLPRRLMVAVMHTLAAPPWNVRPRDVIYVVSQPLKGALVLRLMSTRSVDALSLV